MQETSKRGKEIKAAGETPEESDRHFWDFAARSCINRPFQPNVNVARGRTIILHLLGNLVLKSYPLPQTQISEVWQNIFTYGMNLATSLYSLSVLAKFYPHSSPSPPFSISQRHLALALSPSCIGLPFTWQIHPADLTSQLELEGNKVKREREGHGLIAL